MRYESRPMPDPDGYETAGAIVAVPESDADRQVLGQIIATVRTSWTLEVGEPGQGGLRSIPLALTPWVWDGEAACARLVDRAGAVHGVRVALRITTTGVQCRVMADTTASHVLYAEPAWTEVQYAQRLFARINPAANPDLALRQLLGGD